LRSAGGPRKGPEGNAAPASPSIEQGFQHSWPQQQQLTRKPASPNELTSLPFKVANGFKPEKYNAG
jgi:hypothetical protein